MVWLSRVWTEWSAIFGDAGTGPTAKTVAACVTASVTIGTARDDTGRAGQTFPASAAIACQVGVLERLDRANSGLILRILDSIR